MYAKNMDYEAYIRRKSLPFVDSADKTHPTGLFSPDIFGVTEAERTTKGALINLGLYVMRPLILNLMKRINRKIVQAAITKCEVYIRNGRVEIVDEKYVEEPGDIKGRSGPMFLFNNWDKLDKKQFQQDIGKYSNVQMKKTLTFMSKEEVFEHYVYVVPIGYREEDQDSMMVVNDINVLYSDIVRYSKLISSDVDGIDKTDISIFLQKSVLDLGEYIIDRFLGPKGIGRKQIMSRNVDNSGRLVLLSNNYTKPVLGQSKIKMGTCGIPIHHLTSLFRDTVIKFSTDLIGALYAEGCFPEDTPQDMLIFYDNEYLADQINKFKDKFQRVQDFPAITATGDFGQCMVDMEIEGTGGWQSVRKPLAWIEFFYLVTNGFAHLRDTRYVAVTRYPVDSVLSTQFLKPVTMTLAPTKLRRVRVLGMEFDDFPLVDDWLKENYHEKVFETGLRSASSVTRGFNGKHEREVAPVYSNMYLKVC